MKKLKTAHGSVNLPVFMPVGTAGSVKALSPQDLKELGAQIILGNTYHLYLRPGEGLVKKFGGLHKFMGWDRAILTDSGGFQVMSIGTKITEEGVEFKSHIDGSKHLLTPEKSIKIQQELGADIIMAFDQATPTTDRQYTKAAMERTHRWLSRSKKAWTNKKQKMFGIIQGGKFKDLRRESAKFVIEQNLPGVAIGGESIGSDAKETAEVISWVKDLLPEDRPLYAMGVGVRPSDLKSVIAAGADMFDCVAPTRLARTGYLFHPGEKNERLNISLAKFALDKKQILDDCDCYTCKEGFSRGYLHHLFRSRELLYYRLASIHNLRVMIRTVEEISG